MLLRTATLRQGLPLWRLIPSRSLNTLSRHAPPSLETSRTLRATKLQSTQQRKRFRALLSFERRMGTAAELAEEQIPDDLIPDDVIPFEGGRPLYEIRDHNTSEPLRPEEYFEALSSSYYHKERPNVSGIPGDVNEMLAVFDACVQVGKLERASLVLKRFAKMGVLAREDLLVLHNCWLYEKVGQVLQDPSEDSDDAHRWFELEMRKPGLFDRETIAYMLKITLLSAEGERMERLVQRYMGLLGKEDGLENLFEVEDALTIGDLLTITEICPEYDMPDGVELLEGEEGTPSIDPNQPARHIEAPEVVATPQKGSGLTSLKSTLSLFSQIPIGHDIASLSASERREVQARLERDCVDAAINRWREENQSLQEMGLNTSISTPVLSAKLYDWFQALEARFVEEIAKVEASEEASKKGVRDVDRCLYGPFLRQSSPKRLAAVTIIVTLNALTLAGADRGIPLSSLIGSLARVAEEDIQTQIKLSNKQRKAGAQRMAEIKKKAQAASAETELTESWPLLIRTKVGAAMLEGLLETAKMTVSAEHPVTKAPVTQLQPAFTHTTQLRKGRKVGVLLANRTLLELMRREPSGDLLARHLPMVSEPEPWTRFDKGGFLSTPVSLVRIKHGEKDQKFYAIAAMKNGDLDQVLKGLDVLGKTGWNINRPVFDVMLEVWNSGEGFASIPPLNPDMQIPPEPDSREDPAERRNWIRKVKSIENERSGLHSVRCFMNFQLEIARAFRDQTFYFPHNIDFRGRAYPMPTYLNHMGADHVRGLLRFAKGKTLGENGLRWLKVQLANVYGYDKASLKDREDFATEHIEDIRDSANNPLKGRKWWLQAEDPWQCLAACFELNAALELPDPTQYVSHLPVHQDGTCNGLQHYAALGGDTWGAQQVNLIPGDKPADVYSAVANLLEENLVKEAAAGNQFAQILSGKITRKVVKQTVMTNVYGVTFIGAKKQVLKQLDNLYPKLGEETGIPAHFFASYIAAHIFKALSTMFSGAHDIQSWFVETGSRICQAVTKEQIEEILEDQESAEVEPEEPLVKKRGRKKANTGDAADEPGPKKGRRKKITEPKMPNQFNSTLVWTTPLRMPVVQPYRKTNSRKIETCLQSLVLADPELGDPVDRRKQLQAFPPNFIHSLDASHMLLSALECDTLGLTFAAVHDSFWTHAADVDAMNDVIRDSFIRIHQEDVIGRLLAEFQARYRHSLYLAEIARTSAVAKAIIKHRKDGKLTTKEELMLEYKRQELLRSKDPEKVQEGQKMVTPASIFESMATESDLVSWHASTPSTDSVADDADPGSEDGGLAEVVKDIASAEAVSSASEVEEETLSQALNREPLENTLKKSGFAGLLQQAVVSKESAKSKKPAVISFWRPLTLPPVPQKGDFDVSQLRGSKYFFS
ncbi:hypothetical protein OQA88_2320 [Cercophora sp. LCS_1]